MALAKTIEISCESKSSFDDAVKRGVTEASETVRGIKEAWVKEQKVVVEDGKVATYRVHLSITFVIDEVSG